MVQVDRPSPQVALGTADVDSQAITQDAIQPPDGSVDSSMTDGSGGERFLHSDSVPEPETDGGGPAANQAWQSEQTQRSRQIGFVVALSIGSLIIALLIFGLFVRSWSDKTADAVAQDSIATAIDENLDSSEPTIGDGAKDVDTADSAGNEPSTDAPSPPETTDAISPMVDRDATKTLDSPADLATVDDTGTPIVDSSEIPADLMPESPLIIPSKDASKEAERNANRDSSGLRNLPPGLAEFTNLIDLANDGGIRKPTLAAPPSMDETQIEGPAEESIDPMMIATPPPPINMKRGLAIQMALAPTDEQGYPLADLVLLISQVTGIPIQLDWVSFDVANIDVRIPVKTSKGWKNTSQILDEIANIIGAEIDQRESLIFVTLADETIDAPLRSILALDDFGDGRDSAAVVIGEFLGVEAKKDTNDRIAPGPSRSEQQLAAISVETLRKMRGLAAIMSDERLSRWSQSAEQRPESWNPLSGVKSGPQYDAPVAIAEVLRRVARENNASCIVNWHDARRRRVSPEQLTLPFAGTDGGQQLASMLEPFGMQIRKVDKNHWWVGTAATYDRLPLVIWTQPLGETREAFTRQIRNIMAGADEDSFRMAIDPVSDRAMLLLPRFIVRQLPSIQANLAVK
tara:strand:- start:1097080 stop:1098972 length:1893 start_codon:yes stop_codon:yes gene_type:complete